MRRLFVSATASLLLSSVVTSAGAAPFVPKMSKPETYEDIKYGLNEVRQNIQSVQCGGWTDIQPVTAGDTRLFGGDVPLPKITGANGDQVGLPGHDNADATGDAKTGVGVRDTFKYPASAKGYQSACDVHQSSIQVNGNFDVEIKEDGAVEVKEGGGKVDINPHEWCLTKNKSKDTPMYCKRLYDALNQISQMVTPDMRPKTCDVPEKYCFDFNSVCNGEECAKDPPPSFSYTPPMCPLNIITFGEQIVAEQRSFYRHYAGDFGEYGVKVQEFKQKTEEQNLKEWKLRVECYDYYNSKDPKTIVTSANEEQCEIVIENNEKPQWVDGQPSDEVSGQSPPKDRQQLANVKPDTNDVKEEPREERKVPDPWKADTKTNLSLIDTEKLLEVQKDAADPADISAVVGAILPVKQRASKTVTENARTDEFDDTAERDVGVFFEAQQRELLKMTTDPQTRLILPPRMMAGLSTSDPLFAYVSHTAQRPSGTVELTLRAGPDDLGMVLQSLERIAVGTVLEVPIPILVPLASESAIDTHIFEWQQWKQQQDRENKTNSMAAKADPLIAKLQEYKAAIQKVRELRNALPQEIQKLYEPQKKIRGYFAQWFIKNTQALQGIAKRAEQRRELVRIWRLLQQSMLKADSCQMQWCSNQRYSLAVYSLLDEWWGDGAAGSNRDPSYKPADLRSLNYQLATDQVFDFSNVGFSSEPLLVPVLWPVQVAIGLPRPEAGVEPPTADKFPSLPALPADPFSSFKAPDVKTPDITTVTAKGTQDLEPAKDILRQIRQIVDGTSTDIQKQQEEQLKAGKNPDPLPPKPLLGRDNMVDAYCRFPNSVLLPPPQEDFGDAKRIIHVEHDLRERVARLFARWMPERMEDFGGRAVRVAGVQPKPECHEDVVCMLLPPQRVSITTWQWFVPSSSSAQVNAVATSMRDLTLPKTEAQNPYRATIDVLGRIFPKLTLPVSIDLTVPPPSR